VRHAPAARLTQRSPALPLYDYDCAACGRRFEVIHGVHGDPPATCPLCGSGPVKKAISAPSVHFKGSGWAKRDRRAAVRSGSKSESADEGSTDGSKASEKSDSSSDAGEGAVAATAGAGAGDASSGGASTKPSKSSASSKSRTKTSD
jgi:putative FmdB family regulatory protein